MLATAVVAPVVTANAVQKFNDFKPEVTVEKYETLVLKRDKKFFDIVNYVGNGGSLLLPNLLNDEVCCVMIKCTSVVTDWYLLELTSSEIVLPEQCNNNGHTYIAYLFGKSCKTQIQPYIDEFKENYETKK